MTRNSTTKIRPVILCGGQGTRLWPVSRSSFPKQFNRIFSDKSLFQETIELVTDENLFSAPLIVGADKFEHILVSHMKEIGHSDPRMILESEGRNTAAALALACHISDPDEILLVLPSDHRIKDKQQFHRDVRGLLTEAESGRIGLFGIRPDHASVDYGYVEIGAKAGAGDNTNHAVKAFREKPDLPQAEIFLGSGQHYWNAGIFLFSKDTMERELKIHAGQILKFAKNALDHGRRVGEIYHTNEQIYAETPALPIDIAVMEATDKAMVRLAQFDWLDIGSWKSYASTCEPDCDGNSAAGPVFLEDCHENLIIAGGKLVTAIGLEGHAIIDTDDALLIMPKDRAGQLSSLVKKMKAQGINEASDHVKVRRPWGSYKGIHHGAEHQVKHIIVKPHEKLSYQYHHYRSEHWIIVQGRGVVTIGETEQDVTQNDSVYIPVGTAHRLYNPFDEELHLIEVQYGSYLGEDDIVRLEDVYGRVETTADIRADTSTTVSHDKVVHSPIK